VHPALGQVDVQVEVSFEPNDEVVRAGQGMVQMAHEEHVVAVGDGIHAGKTIQGAYEYRVETEGEEGAGGRIALLHPRPTFDVQSTVGVAGSVPQVRVPAVVCCEELEERAEDGGGVDGGAGCDLALIIPLGRRAEQRVETRDKIWKIKMELIL